MQDRVPAGGKDGAADSSGGSSAVKDTPRFAAGKEIVSGRTNPWTALFRGVILL